MKSSFGKWMLLYGVFLVLMGVAGFLSNPEKAKTALLSGGTFGGVAILLGCLAQRGASWPRGAAVALTAMLTGVFCWRSIVSWMAYAGGQSEKLTAALLITAMGLASIAMLITALRALADKSPPAAGL
jgi:uncharacterized membrane protein (UPF0136 family)